MARNLSPIKQKIILLLLAGLALGLTYSPSRQWKIIGDIGKEWKKIDEANLRHAIQELYKTKVIERKENSNGSQTFILTKKGKLKALTFNFRQMALGRKNWDGKWRIVIFDIPEKLRSGRDALRQKLKELGFYELQKSVLIFPYPCADEIEFVIEFFGMRKFVRYGVLETIDNEPHLKKLFHLV